MFIQEVTYQPGLTSLYAYPRGEDYPFTTPNWNTYKRLGIEEVGGVYTFTLDEDISSDWTVFNGDTLPSDHWEGLFTINNSDVSSDTPSTPSIPVGSPSSFTLVADQRYLRGIVREFYTDPKDGISQTEATIAEQNAWNYILARMSGLFDVSEWTTTAPIPIFEIWDKLASSQVVGSYLQKLNVKEEDDYLSVLKMWMDSAERMLTSVVNPKNEGERIHLLNPTTGKILSRRNKQSVPLILNSRGFTFFGRSQGPFSMQKFLAEHGDSTRLPSG